MRSLRLRKVKQLPTVTQLVSGGAGTLAHDGLISESSLQIWAGCGLITQLLEGQFSTRLSRGIEKCRAN